MGRMIDQKEPTKPTARFAEIAGGKTAECAAICCCCPCGLANLFIFAAVRMPAGLFRRALRKRIHDRRVRRKAKLVGSSTGSNSSSSSDPDGFDAMVVGTRGSIFTPFGDPWPEESPSAVVFELEREVWSKFCSGGFWRSGSQRNDDLFLAPLTERRTSMFDR